MTTVDGGTVDESSSHLRGGDSSGGTCNPIDVDWLDVVNVMEKRFVGCDVSVGPSVDEKDKRVLARMRGGEGRLSDILAIIGDFVNLGIGSGFDSC